MKLHPYQEVARDFLRGRPKAGLFLDLGFSPRCSMVSAVRVSVCSSCGSTFEQPSKTGRPRKKCRPDCGWFERPCPQCGEVFYGYPKQKFCSQGCHLSNLTSDPDHQSKAGKVGGRVRGEQLTSNSQNKGYVRNYDGPTRRHEHRVVAERALGRPLLPGEVVHHEDLDIKNNRPSNLIVFPSQAAHAKHHKLDHPGSPCDCPCIRFGGDAP